MTLTEVLAKHQWHHSGGHRCSCDSEDNVRIEDDAAMAAHQAEMVAAAGLCVVELPPLPYVIEPKTGESHE